VLEFKFIQQIIPCFAVIPALRYAQDELQPVFRCYLNFLDSGSPSLSPARPE